MTSDTSLPAPLVLIVEDDERSRELAEQSFTDRECRVISVSNPDDAVWQFRSSPGIDLLYTDAHLKDKDGDTSGLRLGGYVKTLRPEIPVAVYSSYFNPVDLDKLVADSARSQFDLVLERGGPDWGSEKDYEACVAVATEYRNTRFATAAQSPDLATAASIQVMREFVVGGTPKHPSDEMLKRSGYTLRLLDVRYGQLRGPIAVWVLQHGSQVSAELYQYSRAHAVGDSIQDALERLAVLLRSELDGVPPGTEVPSEQAESIPWLMMQHADEWESLASDIESRD
jgi:CheY-like chemotaxis protein